MIEVGKTNHGVTCNVTDGVVVPKITPQIFVEEIAELDELMEDDVDPKIVLPDEKVEELLREVKTAFNK